MRKQEKYIYTGAIVTASIVGLFDIFLQNEKQKMSGQKLTWQNYNGIRTLKNVALFGFVGGIAGNEFYKCEFKKEINRSFSSDKFLKNLLKEESSYSNLIKMEELKSINTHVKETLNFKLSNQLVNYPENIGSLSKRTALASTCDSDIVLPIKKQSTFGSIPKMSNEIHKIILDEFKDEAEVKKLKKATSLLFKGNEGIQKVDILYGQEIGNYKKDKKLNLYIRPSYFWEDGKIFKTDIGIQKNLLVNKPKVREVIKVIKKYRDRNHLSLENILIDQLVLDALSIYNYGKGHSVLGNLKACLEHIAYKLSHKKILDLANSNNNLFNKIDYPTRETISSFINNDLLKIKSNPHYIKEIFHQ